MKLKSTIARGTSWLQSRAAASSAVLLYHRVRDVALDSFAMSVAQDRFDAQMAYLARNRDVVPLIELVHLAKSGKPARGAVAVTFDDGFSDVLSVAAPVLQAHSLPATIFAIAGCSGEELWWDKLERLVRTPRTLPSRIRIAALGIDMPCSSREAGRVELLRVLHRACLRLDSHTRDAALSDLAAQITGPSRDTHRCLTHEQISQLAALPGIDFAAHTMTHPVLSALSAADQKSEITESRAVLKRLTGRKIELFAYPYGLPEHFNADSVRLVKEAGFLAAFTARTGVLSTRSNPYLVPRLWIRNVEPAVFGARLRRWLG